MVLPYSPSLTMSRPISACLRTTSATLSCRHVSKAGSSYGCPSRWAARNSRKRGGRTKLPTWVVGMRPPLAGERRGAALLRAGLRADFTGMTKFPPSRPAFLPGSHRPRPLAHDPEKLKPVFGQDHAQNNGLGRAAVHGSGVSLWDHAGCAVSILCTM